MCSENGKRFEIWLEKLLKLKKYQNVLRNTEYRKNGYKREVDVSYNIIKSNKIYLALVEAKYSEGNISWNKRKKQNQHISINNLIDEIWERHLFVKADYSILATNTFVNDRLRKKVEERKIKILDRNNLIKMYKSLGGEMSLEDSIKRINLEKYQTKRNIIYLN